MVSKKIKIQTAVILALIVLFSMSAVFADGNWGQNTYTFVQQQVWYIALLIVAIISVKFIAKKMWVQLGGFLLLSAIVLVIISGPDKLKIIGETIWNAVFR
jgi:cell division protein FtsW (lipid II flippase)